MRSPYSISGISVTSSSSTSQSWRTNSEKCPPGVNKTQLDKEKQSYREEISYIFYIVLKMMAQISDLFTFPSMLKLMFECYMI